MHARRTPCDLLSHQPPVSPFGRTLKAAAVKWQAKLCPLPVGITKIKPIANRLYKWLNQNLIKASAVCTRWSEGEYHRRCGCHQSLVVAGPRNFNNDHVSWQRIRLVVLVHVRQLPALKGFICELPNAKRPAPKIHPTRPTPRT